MRLPHLDIKNSSARLIIASAQLESKFSELKFRNEPYTVIADCFQVEHRDRILKSPDFKQNSPEKPISNNEDGKNLAVKI